MPSRLTLMITSSCGICSSIFSVKGMPLEAMATVKPRLYAWWTMVRKSGWIDGSPPVITTENTPISAHSSSSRRMRSVLISISRGAPASTKQCGQRRLQARVSSTQAISGAEKWKSVGTCRRVTR